MVDRKNCKIYLRKDIVFLNISTCLWLISFSKYFLSSDDTQQSTLRGLSKKCSIKQNWKDRNNKTQLKTQIGKYHIMPDIYCVKPLTASLLIFTLHWLTLWKHTKLPALNASPKRDWNETCFVLKAQNFKF